jgi:hypothetical protein
MSILIVFADGGRRLKLVPTKGPCRKSTEIKQCTRDGNHGNILWMRSSLVVRLERLIANAEVATVLSSIPASSDSVESNGRQMKQC